MRTYKDIIEYYNRSNKEIQNYFRYLPDLLTEYPLDISIAYIFTNLEMAHNMTIYCGTIKLYKTDSILTWKAIMNEHITRNRFKELFYNIFDKEIQNNILTVLKNAEKTRDKIMHGFKEDISEIEKRKALVYILQYADLFNTFVYTLAQFKPFSVLRGFKGRASSLDKKTSKLILKGLGFNLS